MHRVFREYERRKEAEGLIDFEDLLELAVRLFEENAQVRDTFRAQYRAFTVDEYQDVNLLQQQLLDHWLGDRDDLCVVGDDYQSIYAFTGAGPEHLLDVPRRYPHALVVRLEENYRSTPQVLELANRLVPKLGGAEKVLRADAGRRARAGRPRRSRRRRPRAPRSSPRSARSARRYERIAILARTNARLTDFEELLHDARIPFQGASLLERDAARRLLRRLERVSDVDAEEAVRAAALDAGWLVQLPDKLGEREVVRQTDLARLVSLASIFDGSAAAFVADLRRRFDSGADAAKGVHLLTLHRAKGLEFEAVFLPRLRGEGAAVPTGAHAGRDRRGAPPALRRDDARQAGALADLVEPTERFLEELGIAAVGAARRSEAEEGQVRADSGLGRPLPRARRLAPRPRRGGRGAAVRRLPQQRRCDAIARTRRPRRCDELARSPGVGPAKLERYGDEVLAVVGRD